jgi:hypothetical protein
MLSRFRLSVAGLFLIFAGLLIFLFTPLLVSAGLHLWIFWKARTEKLIVKIDRIEAPLFRPVVIRGLHVRTRGNPAIRFDATANQVTIALNLQSILLRTRGRAIHALAVADLQAELHRNYSGTPMSDSGWNTLQRLVPESFTFDRLNLRVENGSSVVLFRNVAVTANPIESGRFRASEIMITSPLFRQSFSDLKGSANWQNERLTLAGLALTRGLDAQSLTFDFGHLSKRRMGVEADLDAFGGKIRASVSNEWRGHHPNWNIAGSANDISLSQTAEAIGFTNRVGGLLHAGKFTFRGDIADPLRASGSVWAELTAPAWRDREADVIMLGVSLYNRQLQLQQLYVKQRKNQLTLSGGASFPTSSAAWLRPEFSGDISASINDLGDFASLFGGARGDFAGQIAIEGVVNAHERRIGGNLTASGAALTMFKSSIDSFDAQVNFKPNEVEVEQIELKRGSDVLRVQGRMDTQGDYNYSGSLDATFQNLSEYLSKFCQNRDAKPTSAEIHATVSSSVWKTQGTIGLAASSPIDFTATFPIQIGKDWNDFLNSPIEAAIDLPSLSVAGLPRCFSVARLQSGMLKGKLSITETLRSPNVLGHLELADGQLSSSEVSHVTGRVAFRGHRAAIDGIDAGTPQGRLSFSGDMDFANTGSIAVHLFPGKPLADLTPGLTRCVSGFEIMPVGSADAPAISELELRGSLFQSDWRVLLREPLLGPLANGLDWDPPTREFPVCESSSPARTPLVFGVQPREEPKPAKIRRRR